MRERYNTAGLDRELGCPFHGNAQWRHIRDTSPSEWADVVECDAAHSASVMYDGYRRTRSG